MRAPDSLADEPQALPPFHDRQDIKQGMTAPKRKKLPEGSCCEDCDGFCWLRE